MNPYLCAIVKNSEMVAAALDVLPTGGHTPPYVMGELDELDGRWKQDSASLQTEILQRLQKLRNDRVLRNVQQLDDWLRGLRSASVAALDFDEPRQTGRFHSRSRR